MATRTDAHSPALHVADSHDLIRVHGARVNNLKDVSIEIPKRRLTVHLFTGVSGSGQESLVFGTIAAKSQRLINETYRALRKAVGAKSAGAIAAPRCSASRAYGTIASERSQRARRRSFARRS